ncbi:Maleamate amidohydrolase [Cyphellophora attinorum]|uniref:Maleamate amidohydrolase n=1 Tax=Cyphellophora attinorum TaxID=1664694 RepID=A0A0N1I1Y7_9EURO|nr:Maleamate amidohydrolase [Phialophora attinorum]KPI46060.1 Maleamate amidohydrolase [Phialophora attinorum]
MASLEDNPSHASYYSSGFSNRIGWGSRPALLLIDVCTAYWTPGSPLDITSNPAGNASPESMRKLLAAARKGGVPVLWTRVEYTSKDMSDAGLFYKKAKALSVWQVGDERGLEAWVEGLVPADGEVVVTKKYPSGFWGTTLGTNLTVLGVDTLVICGVSTSGCIRATVLDAMQHGYRPMIVGSACGDRTAAIHDANMFDMNAKNGDAVSEEEAVEKLRAGWGTK